MPQNPNILPLNRPLGTADFSTVIQKWMVHLEPINVLSCSFVEKIVLHIMGVYACVRGYACIHTRTPLTALAFAAADELWSFGNKSWSLCMAVFGLLTLYSAELQTFFPSLAQPSVGSRVYVPLWF